MTPIASAVPPKVLFSAEYVLYPGDWSGDGRYLALGALDGFTFETPRLLFAGPCLKIGGIEYRVPAGGSSLLLESADPARSTGHLNVIVHWNRELAALMAGP